MFATSQVLLSVEKNSKHQLHKICIETVAAIVYIYCIFI